MTAWLHDNPLSENGKMFEARPLASSQKHHGEHTVLLRRTTVGPPLSLRLAGDLGCTAVSPVLLRLAFTALARPRFKQNGMLSPRTGSVMAGRAGSPLHAAAHPGRRFGAQRTALPPPATAEALLLQ